MSVELSCIISHVLQVFVRTRQKYMEEMEEALLRARSGKPCFELPV